MAALCSVVGVSESVISGQVVISVRHREDAVDAGLQNPGQRVMQRSLMECEPDKSFRDDWDSPDRM